MYDVMLQFVIKKKKIPPKKRKKKMYSYKLNNIIITCKTDWLMNLHKTIYINCYVYFDRL